MIKRVLTITNRSAIQSEAIYSNKFAPDCLNLIKYPFEHELLLGVSKPIKRPVAVLKIVASGEAQPDIRVNFETTGTRDRAHSRYWTGCITC